MRSGHFRFAVTDGIAERSRFVARRRDDATRLRSANCDRLAAQLRIVALLDGGVEGVSTARTFSPPLALAPALVMAGVVATSFMALRREGAIVMFVISGALWLAILLGLGGLDPLTRAFYPAPEIAASTSLKSPLAH